MIKLIKKPGSEERYETKLTQDLPENEKVYFHFRKLDRRTLDTIKDDQLAFGSDGKALMRSASTGTRITLNKLVGWENVRDENGELVKFDPTDKMGCFDLLIEELQDELVEYCNKDKEKKDKSDQ